MARPDSHDTEVLSRFIDWLYAGIPPYAICRWRDDPHRGAVYTDILAGEGNYLDALYEGAKQTLVSQFLQVQHASKVEED